jgi:hypothetical protein
LKVIGAGFGRTGKLSLKATPERPGARPCYHIFELPGPPSEAGAWLSAYHGGPIYDLLVSHEATTHWPGRTFYREPMEACPAAMHRLLRRSWAGKVASVAGPPARRAGSASRAIDGIIWDGASDDSFEDQG